MCAQWKFNPMSHIWNNRRQPEKLPHFFLMDVKFYSFFVQKVSLAGEDGKA